MHGQSARQGQLQPWQVRVALANLIGYVFEAFDLTVYSLFVGVIAKYFHLPLWYSFLVLTLTYVLRAAGGLLFGTIADRYGRRTTLITTVLGYSVCTALTGLAWSVAALVVFRSLTGLFIGGEYTSYAYTMEGVPSRARGLFSGFFQVAYSLGYFLAALGYGAVSGMVTANAWRIVFIVGIVPALIALWLRLGVDESHLWNQVKAAGRTVSAPIRQVFSPRYLSASLLILLFLMGLQWSYGSLQYTWPTYLHLLKEAPTAVTLLTSLSAVGGMAGAVVIGALSQRYGRKRMLLAGCLLSLVGAFFYAPFWWAGTPAMGFLLALGFVETALQTGTFGVLPAWLAERYPTAIRATASAGLYNLSQLVGGWASTFISRTAPAAGGAGPWALTMVLFAVGGLVVAIVFVSLTKETLGARLEVEEPLAGQAAPV